MKPIGRLSFRHKLAYGIASLGEGMLGTTLAFYLLFYYTDIVKVNPFWAGFAVAIGRLWDAVTDPAMGQITDRTRSRWGRRRPYLLFGSIPLGISFLLFWMVPTGWPELYQLLFLGIASILFNTMHTVVIMPYLALGAEITLDYDERTSVMSYRQFFFYLGWLPTAFALDFVGLFDAATVGWRTVGILWAVVLTLGFLITFGGNRENEEFQTRSGLPFGRSLKETFRNRNFLILAITLFIAAWAFAFGGALWVYIVKYVLAQEAMMKFYLPIIVLSTLAFIPFYNWLSARIGKKKAFTVSIIGFGFCHGSGFVLFDQAHAWTAFIFCAIHGLGAGGFQLLSFSLVGDIADVDELKTYQRREGMYFGVLNFIQKCASSAGIFIVGYILGFLKINPDVAPDARGLLGLKIAYTLFPLAVLVTTGIVFYLLFPLSREGAKAVRAALDARAAESAAK